MQSPKEGREVSPTTNKGGAPGNLAIKNDDVVFTNESPYKPQFFNWGLIPFWVKDEKKAGEGDDAVRSKPPLKKRNKILELLLNVIVTRRVRNQLLMPANSYLTVILPSVI